MPFPPTNMPPHPIAPFFPSLPPTQTTLTPNTHTHTHTQMAERFGLPVITLVDTVGAWPTFECERDGQSEVTLHGVLSLLLSSSSFFFFYVYCFFLVVSITVSAYSVFLRLPSPSSSPTSSPSASWPSLSRLLSPLLLSLLLHPQQAIATNLTVMAGLKVPIITVMIGEGGMSLHYTVSVPFILYCS